MFYSPIIYSRYLYDRLYFNQTQSSEYYISYPQLLSVAHPCAAHRISNSFKDLSAEYVQYIRDNIFEHAVPAKITQSFSVPYQTHPYLSVLIERREFYQNPSFHFLKAYNFFSDTGKKITLEDLFGTDDYQDYLSEQISQIIGQSDTQNCCCVPDLVHRFDKNNFYLSKEGLTIFYSPEESLPTGCNQRKFHIDY